MSETPLPAGPDAPPLQRTISPVSGRLAPARLGALVVLAGAVLGCGVLIMATWRPGSQSSSPPSDQAARQVVAFEAAPTKGPTLNTPSPQAPSLSDQPQTTVPALQPNPQPPSHAQTPAAAPLIAYSQGSPPGAARPSGAEPTPPAPTELDALRRSSAINLARATRLPNRDFLTLAGSTLPCILQTAMSSATPGYVSCVIPRDVLSETGRVVLLEKGTKVMGEYRATLRQGQRRMFVLWTRAVTPTGISVPLASPAADALGRAGFDGVIDTHFWDRFGAALLLSLVDSDARDVSQNRSSQAERLPSDAAGVALEAAVDIPPTLTKPQGGEVSIFVAQDLDFSSVYELAGR